MRYPVIFRSVVGAHESDCLSVSFRRFNNDNNNNNNIGYKFHRTTIPSVTEGAQVGYKSMGGGGVELHHNIIDKN